MRGASKLAGSSCAGTEAAPRRGRVTNPNGPKVALVSIGTDPARRSIGMASVARWIITLAATAVSTFALDLIATGVGLLLVASQVLDGLGHGMLVVFLIVTYVAWGAGLRVNLIANSMLLEQTGTSSNALSKAAYDLVRLRTRGLRAARIAASIGYVVMELAKEAPYYVGAFGAVLATSSVSSSEALIFLAGTNLGAGAYEFGLARATRAFLRTGAGDGGA